VDILTVPGLSLECCQPLGISRTSESPFVLSIPGLVRIEGAQRLQWSFLSQSIFSHDCRRSAWVAFGALVGGRSCGPDPARALMVGFDGVNEHNKFTIYSGY
jgi:hypothetical protein